jgi:hypothetical protein
LRLKHFVLHRANVLHVCVTVRRVRDDGLIVEHRIGGGEKVNGCVGCLICWLK